MVTEAGRVSWFALGTKRNWEKHVADNLQGKGYECFLPLYRSRRRWSDRYKDVQLPLFPGYVFSRFDPVRRLPILITPGVVQVIGQGRIPIPVEDHEIDALRAVAQSTLLLQPWPYLQVGQRVVIREGALAGVEGLLLEVKKSFRLVVSVNLLQRSVAVEVDRAWVQPLSAAPARYAAANAALI